MGIILAIFIFGFIIFFHELGHFLLARKNKIDVDEFWMGMGPTLVHKKVGKTDYCLKLFPIGGACVMGEDELDDLSEGSFNNKSPWARISVILAGPIFNFILAFICALIFIAVIGVDKPIVSSVERNSPAEEAGLMEGDQIVEMNGKSIHIFRDIQLYNQFHHGEIVELVYERAGKETTVKLTPVAGEDGFYRLGVGSTGYTKGNLLENLGYSAYEVKYWIELTIKSLGQLVTGQISVKQLSGPVGVVDVFDDTYQQSKSGGPLLVFVNMLRMAILLSANLGVMNLLPLPALDGGRLVFLILEVIRGKRISPEKEGYVHAAGMVLLLGLMVFVMYNDIRKIFF